MAEKLGERQRQTQGKTYVDQMMVPVEYNRNAELRTDLE